MKRRIRICIPAILALIVALVAACSEDDSSPVAFTINLSPEFVQGAVPGAVTGVLVTITNESATDEAVALTASAPGAQVSVVPDAIRNGEVAEVTVIADPATNERPLEITVTGERDGLQRTAVKSTTVMTWDDDRGEYARTLLHVFLPWLAASNPELGLDATTEFSGSFVAPGLLVVSHYLFLSDDWEIGLSWHVMIPPDDWAEIYLRPRSEAVPTMAFRLSSQDAALNGGTVEITTVAAPAEVVR